MRHAWSRAPGSAILPGMADLGSIFESLARGARSLGDPEAALAEARRIVAELVARGDLSREEAAQLEQAVLGAAAANRRWLDERVVGPLRGGLARTLGSDALAARLDALEARLARIETLLAGRRDGPG